MTEPIPFPDSPYCRVRAWVASIWADGPDDGTHPDWRPAAGEKVTLTPSIGSQLLTYDVGGADPIIVTVERVDCVVGEDGLLTTPDGRPVYIAPTDDPLLSATGWTWTANIKGKSVPFAAPSGGVVDLAMFIAAPATDNTKEWVERIPELITAGANAVDAAAEAVAARDTATGAASIATAARDAAQAAAADVEARAGSFATTVPGKNLYNYATDTLDAYLGVDGEPIAFAGYRLSALIPVTPGQSYTIKNARHWAFYNQDGFMPATYQHPNPPVVATFTAPPGATGVRFSYSTAVLSPLSQQVELGNTSTSHEPYSLFLDPAITVTAAPPPAPLAVNRTGDQLAIVSDLGGSPLTLGATLAGNNNGVFNFGNVAYLGVLSGATDDVAPIRTQQGTVGANHGCPRPGRWPAGTHDKTTADQGSVWSDGTSEYVILTVDSAGDLYVGRAYNVSSGGAVYVPTTAPSSDLTHVSGATHTAPLASASRTGGQLYPWVQRRRITAVLDGQALAEGASTGHELVIRESYEILDYGAVYDWAKNNLGQHYSSAHHKAAVGVETEWRIRPGGKMRTSYAIWEISPTALDNCGFFQAQAMSGPVTRYLPGVAPIGGLAWDQGVDLALLTSNQLVTSADLLDPAQPPTVCVDVRSNIAHAIAVSPWDGASQAAERLASAPGNLWDLRSSKKIYPNVVGSTPPGWGRLEVHGIRAYLTPDEAASVVTDADPLSAWVTLDHIVG